MPRARLSALSKACSGNSAVGSTCTDTGVFFQNRGAGFSLAPGPNQLAPGKHPFHTLNPAMAELNDGRVLSMAPWAAKASHRRRPPFSAATHV